VDAPDRTLLGSVAEANFVANLKGARESLGLSQSDLAARMRGLGFSGFYQTTVSRLENGERPVRLGEAIGFATALHQSLDALLVPEELARWMDRILADIYWLGERASRFLAARDDLQKTREGLATTIAEAERLGYVANKDAGVGSLEHELSRAQLELESVTIEQLLRMERVNDGVDPEA